jgi:hypothetical protein
LETKPQEIPCPSTDAKGKRNDKEMVNRWISTVVFDEINCMKGYIKEKTVHRNQLNDMPQR